MRRWCCSSAATLTRRVLSFPSAPDAVHANAYAQKTHRCPPSPSAATTRTCDVSLPLPRGGLLLRSPPAIVRPPVTAMQVRHFAIKGRSRAPTTPTISKVKKYKMKAPSSMKFRFRTMQDGQISRWRAGKRHNAHLRSKQAKQRLRQPALVHLAYTKVIKKLNFCG